MSDSNLCNLYVVRETVFGDNSLVRASGTLTLTGQPTAGQTVTIGTASGPKTYTFRSTVVTLQTANDVLIGATYAQTALNLIAAINLTAGAGSVYAASTVAHPLVYAETGGAGVVVVKAIAPGIPPGLAKASRVLTFAGQPANGDTVTIDGKTYTFQTVLTDVDGNVFIGANVAATIANLEKAIELGAGSGVSYAASTVIHPTVIASAIDATTLTAEAKTAGTAGNSIVVTEAGANTSWASGTLTGGTDDTIGTTETMSNASWASATLTGGAGTAPTFQEIRFKSEGIVPGKETVQSEEVRDDRSVRELVQVGKNSRGPVACEMHFEGLDMFLLAALMASDWTSGTLAHSCDITGDTIDSLGSDWSVLLAGIENARYVKIENADDPANDGIHKIVSVVGSVITLESGSITSDATSDNLTLSFRYARNGVFLPTFQIVKEFLSLTPIQSVACLGMFLNQMELTLEPKSVALVNLNFGGAEQISSPGRYGTATPTEAPETPIINTSANVGDIGYNGDAIDAPVMRLAMSINNNLADRPAISHLTTLSPRKGTLELTGQLNAYFQDRYLLEDFLNHENRSIEFPLVDSEGNTINFYLPKCAFAAAQALVAGINTDLMMPLNFQALKSEEGEDGYVIQIDNLEA